MISIQIPSLSVKFGLPGISSSLSGAPDLAQPRIEDPLFAPFFAPAVADAVFHRLVPTSLAATEADACTHWPKSSTSERNAIFGRASNFFYLYEERPKAAA